MTDSTYLGLLGLATDVYAVYVPLSSSSYLPRSSTFFSVVILFTLVSLTPFISPIISSHLISSHAQPPYSHDQFRLRVNTYTFEKERESTSMTFAHLGRGGSGADTDAGCC
jgi:hypothetical protein